MIPPLLFTWDGEAMVPFRSALADRHYVVDGTYSMAPYEDRSVRSHNHFFALVASAWQTLPEDLADQYPTPEHLRKRALIKTGYRDERSVVCSSHAEALRVAAFTKPIDDYAVVIVRENVVVHYTAKSQSIRAMGKELFQQSKVAVLDELARLIGVTPDQLQRNAPAVAAE